MGSSASGSFDDLPLDQLKSLYDEAINENEISLLEEAIAHKRGFANADEAFKADAKSFKSPATDNYFQYTTRTLSEEKKALTTQPFYIAEPHVLPLNHPSHLCSVCRHLNFDWMVHNLLPKRELSLGFLSDFQKREHCAFCRLVCASISIAMSSSAMPYDARSLETEVGLATVNKDHHANLFDLTIYLGALPPDKHPRIYIQRLALQSVPHSDLGRKINQDAVDVNEVRRWLSDCQNGQAGHVRPSFERSPTEVYVPAYLIDVKRKCIVKGQPSYRYIALSYVLGGPAEIQLTMKLLPLFSTPGALDSGSVHLPITIRDAMILTGRLDECFLWVDSLCIVDTDKAEQIAAMDKIYGSAILVIISAAGHNAQATLPGVRDGSISRSQHIETMQGMRFANRLSGKFDTVDRSFWNTRAWTYQERILSNRKLFITKTQWTFMCEHTEIELCEDVYSQVHRPSTNAWREGEKRSERWATNYNALDMAIPYGAVNTALYSRIVERFTGRDVSFLSDILNAFAGVASLLSRTFRDEFILGIPATELDTQLLWHPAGRLERRCDPQTGEALFPSWTWAGWVGEVICRHAGKPNEAKIEVRVKSSGSSTTCFVDMDCYRDAKQGNWNLLDWRQNSYWQEDGKDDSYYAHPLRPSSAGRKYSIAREPFKGHDCILFYADVASLHVSGEELEVASYYHPSFTGPNDVTRSHALTLLTQDGIQAGTVIVPGSIATKLPAGSYDCVQISRTDNITSLLEPAELIPFIACIDDRLTTSGTNSKWEQVDILVVQWDAKHEMAFRVGAGVCHATTFESCNPTRELITIG